MTTKLKKITKDSMTKLAFKLMEYFHKNEMWDSTIIYAAGKRYLSPGYAYNKEHLYKTYKDDIKYVEEDADVKDYVSYSNPDTVTIAFEGLLYDIIDNDFGFILKLDKKFLEPYGLYFELGNQWNMSAYEG